MRPGQTEQLPGGRGSVTLDRVSRWGGLVVRHDPRPAPRADLRVCALIGLVLMLSVRQQRLFVRVTDQAAAE